MTKKKPFDKENTTKIPFSDLIELINQKCDYKFAIIDKEVDEEYQISGQSHPFKQENQETQTEDICLSQDDWQPLCIR